MFTPDDPIQDTDEGCRLFVHAQPGAKKNALRGLHGGRLKVQVKAPPVDGAANDALIAFLAAELGVATRDVALSTGPSGRKKSFEVAGLKASEARRLLGLI